MCSNRRFPWWALCAAVWLAAVGLLTAAAFAGANVGDLREGYHPAIRVPPDRFPGIWARWDSPYYVDIATLGYEPNTFGFFPLFPLLMRIGSELGGTSPAMAGLVIAQVSYLACLLLLYKIARLVHDDHSYAMRCVLAMALFPTSFFFLAVYAESLALAFGLLAAHFLLRERPAYLPAGAALGLASATRPVGWLLLVMLPAEFLRRRSTDGTRFRTFAAASLLAGSGVLAFVLYLYGITGTLFAIPDSQSAWFREWRYPWVTLADSLRIAATGNRVENDWFLYANNAVDLAMTLFALVLTGVAVARSARGRFPWSLTLYLLASLAFLLSLHGVYPVPLWGMSRWVAPLFPLYLVAGAIRLPSRLERALPAASSALLVTFTAWWASGRWIG